MEEISKVENNRKRAFNSGGEDNKDIDENSDISEEYHSDYDEERPDE